MGTLIVNYYRKTESKDEHVSQVIYLGSVIANNVVTV